MNKIQDIDDVIRQTLDRLSPELQGAREELHKLLRANFSGMVEKMGLVSRAEYDLQVQLLQRLHKRVAELEQQVRAYQNQDANQGTEQGANRPTE